MTANLNLIVIGQSQVFSSANVTFSLTMAASPIIGCPPRLVDVKHTQLEVMYCPPSIVR